MLTAQELPVGHPEDFEVCFEGHPFSARRFRCPQPTRHPPMVLLNGAFQSMSSWKRFVDAFREHSDVVLIDLPGSGDSEVLPESVPLNWLVSALRCALRCLQIDRVYLIGSSYSSAIAYKYAQQHPRTVERLALYGVMPEFPPHERRTVERSIEHARAGNADKVANACLSGLLAPPSEVHRGAAVRRVLSAQIQAMNSADLERYASNSARLLAEPPLDLQTPPAMPTLAFTGEADRFTTPGRVREVARAIPGAVFTLVKRADHLGHLQRPDVFVRLLLAFGNGSLLDAPDNDWSPPVVFS